MSLLDIEEIVTVVKHQDVFHWFKSDRELWVLDFHKWRKDFIDAGYELPKTDPTKRFGISVVNDQTIDHFLAEMKKFKLDKSSLAEELASRFPNAKSWWDVGDLFPIMFVDCIRKHVTAFYASGTPMERYVPDGWTGEFEDFADKYDEELFPINEKFWIQDGIDMLEILNERGKTLTEQ